MDATVEQTPEQFASLIWLLEHVGVPAAVGLLIGVVVRSLIKSVLVLGLLFTGALFVMAKMGHEVDTAQVEEQASSLLPTFKELTASGWRMLKSSPAAVIGLAVGFVMREKWRHKKG